MKKNNINPHRWDGGVLSKRPNKDACVFLHETRMHHDVTMVCSKDAGGCYDTNKAKGHGSVFSDCDGIFHVCFRGTFDKAAYYRLEVTLKARYEEGEVYYAFQQNAQPEVKGAYEVKYLKRGTNRDGEADTMTFAVTFRATTSATEGLSDKVSHLYYEGDEKAPVDFDAYLSNQLTISGTAEKDNRSACKSGKAVQRQKSQYKGQKEKADCAPCMESGFRCQRVQSVSQIR